MDDPGRVSPHFSSDPKVILYTINEDFTDRWGNSYTQVLTIGGKLNQRYFFFGSNTFDALQVVVKYLQFSIFTADSQHLAIRRYVDLFGWHLNIDTVDLFARMTVP